MKNNKTRYICDFEGCRHRNEENICCLFNQENCVYYRTLQALNGYKEIAKWCDDCKKIKELEEEKDKAWWEGFDTCKAKAGEANVKLSEELEIERKKNAELTEQTEELKCCANCKYEEQGYMQEPCKSCNRYFPTLKVGARDKWEKR